MSQLATKFKYVCTGCRKEVEGAAPELCYLEFDDRFDEHHACSTCYRKIKAMNAEREAKQLALIKKAKKSEPKKKPIEKVAEKPAEEWTDIWEEDAEEEQQSTDSVMDARVTKLETQMDKLTAGIDTLLERTSQNGKATKAATKPAKRTKR